jgi:hypothetical protein
MALTASQRARFFEILGLPPSGGTIVVTSLVHWPFSNTNSWEPTWNVGDMTDLISAVDARITAMSAETEAICITLITRYTEIEVSPMKVTSAAGGAGGNLVDHELERENIRQRMANAAGIAVPKGGFLKEIQATYGESVAKWARGVGGGVGDR